MRIDRLTAIADMLDALPPKGEVPAGAADFDMGHWVREGLCGTSGCAIGHAILAGIIPELQLTHDPYGSSLHRIPTLTGSDKPNSPRDTGFKAVAEALGISESEADHLFDEERYRPDPDDASGDGIEITPAMVSARIRKFIADLKSAER